MSYPGKYDSLLTPFELFLFVKFPYAVCKICILKRPVIWTGKIADQAVKKRIDFRDTSARGSGHFRLRVHLLKYFILLSIDPFH